MKLLVAYDESEPSDMALVDLRSAGLPDDVKAVVVTVAERWLPPPAAAELLAPGDSARVGPGLDRAREIAERACRRLVTVFPTWDVREAVLEGSPASEILAHADEIGPDLIVVGAHGHTALGRLAFGSVAGRLVAEAACSVRVARATLFGRSPVRIMIGLDDSDAARAAVREVARRRWPEGSAAHIVTVFDPSRHGPAGDDRELGRVDQLQWAAELELRRAGLATSRLALPGDPKRELPRQAESWGADCVFVASRGLGRFARMLLGSVASALVARAHCSVEVVRARA